MHARCIAIIIAFAHPPRSSLSHDVGSVGESLGAIPSGGGGNRDDVVCITGRARISRQHGRQTPAKRGRDSAWLGGADSGRYVRIRLAAAAADNLSHHYRLTATMLLLQWRGRLRDASTDDLLARTRRSRRSSAFALARDSFLEVKIAIQRLTRKSRVAARRIHCPRQEGQLLGHSAVALADVRRNDRSIARQHEMESWGQRATTIIRVPRARSIVDV